jgi:hypothetical protein
MNEQFVTYYIAVKLKELGFNEECLAIYTHNNEHYLAGTFFLHTPHPFTIEELTPKIQDIRESAVYILAPLWQQAISFLKERKVLVAERWDGWEYGAYEWDDFIYCKTKEQAILKAIELST